MGAISGYVSALKSAPSEITDVIKGRNKVKHIAFTAGGALATYALGGIVAAKATPFLAKVPGVDKVLGNDLGKRVFGGMVPVTLGYVAKKFVKGNIGHALFVGGAVASLVELIMPGKMGELLARITPHPAVVAAAAGPTAGQAAAAAQAGPVQGLSGLGTYVDSPSYQGTGALGTYVDSPSYQGTGSDDDLATYVDSPSYQGTGEMDADDDLAGGERGSYLEEGVDYMASYLN